MKTKKIIAGLLAGVLAATAVVSASAVDVELNDDSASGSTAVTATIDGSVPGDVSYIITVPAEVSFGTLTKPDNADEGSYVYCNFDIVATKMEIEAQQEVWVYLKDVLDDSGEGDFYLVQEKEDGNSTMFQYDVYVGSVNDTNIADFTPLNEDDSKEIGTNGYFIVDFDSNSQGNAQPITLVFDENDLFGNDLADIAGNYSGGLVFHSTKGTVIGG